MDDTDRRVLRPERDGMAWPPAHWEAGAADASDHTAPSRGPSTPLVVDVLRTLVLTLVLFAGTRLVVQNFVVQSISMQPTLYEGQFIWVDKLLYRLQHGPRRGEVVVFQSWDQDQPFVKRVIGLPGDSVEVRDGQVLIDGRPLDEPYLTQPTDGRIGPIALGADEYYVMGDNRGSSGDSRIYGVLPADDIIGRAWLRYWPLDQIGLLHGATEPSFASDPR